MSEQSIAVQQARPVRRQKRAVETPDLAEVMNSFVAMAGQA
ncbi:MAG: hypothetical protein ABSF46_01485 [Terriglobia bacterium]